MDDSSHFLLLSKPFSNLELIKEQTPLIRSSHSITLSKKKNKPEALWFFKQYREEELPLAEYETYIGEIYRIILGDKAPKIRVIYNEEGKILGSISKKLSGFVPLSKSMLNIEQLIKGGLSEILFAAYFNAEDDLHKGNFGCNGKIDHDMSAWPITSDFKGKRPILGYTLLPNPKDAFKITKRDIKHFPNVQDIKPFYWPTNFLFASSWALEVAYSNADKQIFNQLCYNPDFEQNKYYAALKILLIPNDTFQNLGSAALTHKNRRIDINNFYLTRQSELYNELLKLKEFRTFVTKNPALFNKILHEFKLYNTSLKKKKSLLLNLTASKTKFYQLWIQCFEHIIVKALYAFQLMQKKISTPSMTQSINACYNALIHLTNELIQLKKPTNQHILTYNKHCNHVLQQATMSDLHKERVLWETIVCEIKNALHSLLLIGVVTEPNDTDQKSIDKTIVNASLDKTISTLEMQQLIYTFAQHLLTWLSNNNNRPSFLLAISQAASLYAPPTNTPNTYWLSSVSHYFDYRHYTRTRIQAVKSYAHKALQLTNSDELTQITLDILTTGEWKPTSFNKILMQELYTAFSNEYQAYSPLQLLQQNMLLFDFYECIETGLFNIDNHLQEIFQEMKKEFFKQKSSKPNYS